MYQINDSRPSKFFSKNTISQFLKTDVNKALQKNPEKRFTNAYDMSEAIHKSLEKDF